MEHAYVVITGNYTNKLWTLWGNCRTESNTLLVVSKFFGVCFGDK